MVLPVKMVLLVKKVQVAPLEWLVHLVSLDHEDLLVQTEVPGSLVSKENLVFLENEVIREIQELREKMACRDHEDFLVLLDLKESVESEA